ncbi:leucyl aminopeptidase family protein [Pseudenhygromyxa sp. WMMC2535]|uniref:leucyl aminopeptidase family protein n=1 Tax=Pseudenhygromyxa sp. WMMC2535 TaxID=2712867 RepID=UPI0015574747|nr:leucyl aminopeptidase family protein [Pseudenhygromyxa sp. WMMC2535]NVB40832.1 leucyl aminopeptidase family protein [Pseudenhygromyxa sp. WMMC2535]
MDHFTGRANAKTVSILALTRAEFKRWKKAQAKATQNWLDASSFEAGAGATIEIPARDGSVARILLGLGSGSDTPLWSYAALPGRLPKGRYQLENELDPEQAHIACLGWALATYDFDRYKTKGHKKFPSLVWPKGVDRKAVERERNAVFLARDLINTPAADLGPAELAEQASTVALEHDASVTVTTGEALIAEGYPAIYAVGKGSVREPRLVDIRWGDEANPKLTLVGKGVVFDTGGLDLKSAAGMKLMKKDMGGAAAILAIAQMIMDAQLPVRLRVLLPIVENAISGHAYRPSDVLETRKGITVEVGNTDAEGRLILCDALAEAQSEDPDLLIDFATLTGAARVALGTELPALFSTDDEVAAAILAAGEDCHDPMWRMPLFRPYRRHLDSKIADINNIASVGQGGAITAALFLQEFVGKKVAWVHVDTMGYNVHARPGRPAGGEAFGVRAMFEMLRRRYAGS